jgi:AcrR family transcriptional regulator
MNHVLLIDFSLRVETVGIDFSNICKWHLHPDRVDAVTKTSTPPGRGYHHGNLRADLIRAATEIISEVGVAHFSIAAAARRTGVSSGAPFRHFRDRKALLLAVALHAADHLADRYRAALAESGDPVEQLAAVAGAYVRFARDAGAEFDVIFTAGLEINRHPELRERTRTLMGLLLPLGFALADDAHSALALLEAHLALAHGYAGLLRNGILHSSTSDPDNIARNATNAARALVLSYGSTDTAR